MRITLFFLCFQQLEKFLPERPEVMDIPEGEESNIEEYNLTEFDPTESRQKDYHPYESDEEDDGMHGHGPGGPGVQCATQ